MTVAERNTILIVDDTADEREALGEFLKANGYMVASADNGKAALNKIEQLQPRLILLDLMMPVMDGFTFLGLAQRNALLKNVPIIVTTGHPSQSPPGATAVLSKPIKPERLLPLLRRFMSDQHSSRIHAHISGPEARIEKYATTT